ncbi:toxin-antitoxin system YwqK family antitoxin [Thermoactinomyces sp. DSM 45892]|uniref:toxin-antitoxin system YwqK family antitoxin n=1 Tax=Thermoactinomyces sp. DSM 45892 TaxID=1882753 RepID=UPI0008990543|nr:hypothetical protein [Thermoactinomyces sp. DSM 45892]SDZ34493.1 hypothetical protein SAMN05444416_12336 [Thermoactinomyces sp. DSM 45892]
MEEIHIDDLNILTQSEVIKIGTEFEGEVCFSGEFGQQVFTKPMEEGGSVFSGLLYEKYPNGSLAYYSFYDNGIPHGITVEFYQDKTVSSYRDMDKGTINGREFVWFENGLIKSIADCKFSFYIHFREWDRNGNLINLKQEPNEFEKTMIHKYELVEKRWSQQDT